MVQIMHKFEVRSCRARAVVRQLSHWLLNEKIGSEKTKLAQAMFHKKLMAKIRYRKISLPEVCNPS